MNWLSITVELATDRLQFSTIDRILWRMLIYLIRQPMNHYLSDKSIDNDILLLLLLLYSYFVNE